MTVADTASPAGPALPPAAGLLAGAVPSSADLEARVRTLDLATKVALVTGATAWSTAPEPAIGLREVVMSDGPAGVRGVRAGETATSLPAPSALAATWDLTLVERVGAAMAAEAREKGVDVVLAPVLNLQRTPVGGRHFECFSEDPTLVAAVGGRLIAAIQRRGVAACAKHFVANESETDRTTYVARVDRRTLREMYLPPFETAVRDAGAWTVMAAYNAVDDGVESAPATEHRHLLTTVLVDEWGFDGLVVSDWAATRTTAPTANAGLDLVMPGPDGPWGAALVEAVLAGEVAESVIDAKVVRVLRLAARVGKLDDGVPAPVLDAPPGAVVSREIAARGSVVLRRDDDVWPLDAHRLRSIAVLGENAVDPYAQGGGSAKVHAPHEVSPLDGLRLALAGTGVDVRHARGGPVRALAPELDVDRTRGLHGAPGVTARCLDADGVVLRERTEPRTNWTWTYDVPPGTAWLELHAHVRLTEPGTHVLELGAIGYHDVLVDGVLVRSARDDDGSGAVLDSSVNAPAGTPVEVMVPEPDRGGGAEGAVGRAVNVTLRCAVVDVGQYGRIVSATLRHRLPGPTPDEELADAVALAAASDVAVVVVGTNGEVESEGWDRTTLALPGRQDELVRAVVAANPRTVVVVNAGAPVLLPWLDDVGTTVWAWLGGQEAGHAVADVLLGRMEPAGRLPWTLPAREEDSPVPDAVPAGGVVAYDEGSDVGYVGWQASGRAPALPFGHGLGWGTWTYGGLDVSPAPDGGLVVAVDVRNDAARAAREVVQVYVSRPGTDGEPHGVRRLAGFACVDAEPGETVRARVRVDAAAFRRWTDAGWARVPGTYGVHVGRSVADVRLAADVTIAADDTIAAAERATGAAASSPVRAAR
ncbi:glycoside hydrolase family 3 domain protein [Beutenbergia cavernae DSM 12333]|uniref:Glycoside hydrolase family 3 domain protein n=1 Tax=Beutenbergia cavernae (strain ATCC BAA-8 / DSM 12333 / CCUG 43141 / JCM 11478 / NBRC 16432 / NCIMB 13614 / HKI 0122) TaxID=471853 RepID=C5C5E5_BEUC1|nr:glycoside hydrolase family 3 N-terminal domain-containing protein [Beutenbergia cavernae]ACQ82285.1 glycoside hydrolase family 3 domain protein [Beutenbergia cavernae DSM 12333]